MIVVETGDRRVCVTGLAAVLGGMRKAVQHHLRLMRRLGLLKRNDCRSPGLPVSLNCSRQASSWSRPLPGANSRDKATASAGATAPALRATSHRHTRRRRGRLELAARSQYCQVSRWRWRHRPASRGDRPLLARGGCLAVEGNEPLCCVMPRNPDVIADGRRIWRAAGSVRQPDPSEARGCADVVSFPARRGANALVSPPIRA